MRQHVCMCVCVCVLKVLLLGVCSIMQQICRISLFYSRQSVSTSSLLSNQENDIIVGFCSKSEASHLLEVTVKGQPVISRERSDRDTRIFNSRSLQAIDLWPWMQHFISPVSVTGLCTCSVLKQIASLLTPGSHIWGVTFECIIIYTSH